MASDGLGGPPPHVLWKPDPAAVENEAVTDLSRYLERVHGVPLADYDALWRWSTQHVGAFWKSVWDYFQLTTPTPFDDVVTGTMPAVRWFEGASLNYAEQVFLRLTDDHPALIAYAEDAPRRVISRADLARDVAALAATLRRAGVRPGDRVAAYLPNRPEAVIGLLATAAVGAVWAICGPDFGVDSARARLGQIRPKVLLAVERYRFGGSSHERASQVRDLATSLPTLDTVVMASDRVPDELASIEPEVLTWQQAIAQDAALDFAPVPFEQPLWVLFSSGTTGVPKGIMHSHGGIVLEHLKSLTFAVGLRPADRFYFYSSTSWMVWNYLIGALLVDATPVLYDGSPTYPDRLGSWRIVADSAARVAGFGAAYLAACAQHGEPLDGFDLRRLDTVIATGSPLPSHAWRWLTDQLDHVRIDSSSGGTDICSAYAGGSPVVPIRWGELSARALGVKAEAWDRDGLPVVDEFGELVITEPMPSMPVAFWDDDEAMTRYRESYFSEYPGVWRHGDWIRVTPDGGMVIEGRSDSTLNRGGVRMGSADIYAAVEPLASVADCLVLGVELPEGRYYMPLFVVTVDGVEVDDDLRAEIAAAIRSGLSKRHLPDEILAAPAIPRTLTGKKIEVPIKRLFQGTALEDVIDLEAVDDPDAVRWFASQAVRTADARRRVGDIVTRGTA